MRPGEIVADRFEIERLAGSGGMGAVYRARDLSAGVPVAVKVLHGHRVEHVARFAREAEVLASFDDPAVVRYVAHGLTPEGEGFLAMEWLEGASLADRVAGGRLSLADTVVLGFRVAGALACAHRAGIVHRDVKPSNVILVGDDIARAKLVDFGIARVLDRTKLTSTGATLGTVGYMAPEQARAEAEIDARADVYALGAVLYRCLAGRPPFEGNEPLAVLMRQAQTEPPRLSELLEDVPPLLDDLLARLLRKARAERPGDGAVVLDELRRLGSFPHGAPPLGLRAAPAQSTVPAKTAAQATTVPRDGGVERRHGSRRVIVAIVAAVALIVGAAAIALAVRSTGAGASRAGSSAPGMGPVMCTIGRCAPITYADAAHVDPLEILPQATRLAQSIDRTATLCSIELMGANDGTVAVGVDPRDSSSMAALSIRFSTRSGKGVLVSAMPGQLSAIDASCPHPVAPPGCTARAAVRASGLAGRPFLTLDYHHDDKLGGPTWEVSSIAISATLDGRTCKRR